MSRKARAIRGYGRASRNLSNSVGKGRKAFTGATFGFFAAMNRVLKK